MPGPSKEICQKCGAQVRLVAHSGLCPRCLLGKGLSESLSDVELGPEQDLPASNATSLGRVGRYELIEEIARGGMGVVYRARDTGLNRTVALKMVLTGQFASKQEMKRFRTEAEAAARLHHPHIVSIYEYGELEGRPFLSMRLVEGANLAKHLNGAPMEGRAVAELMCVVARAVHYAHQRSVLHRDLKPANILVDASGQPYVMDFGLAKCLDSAEGVTLSGALLGSPNYMAPEQAAGHSGQLTTAADIYSLGAILYELLTGRPPFYAGTPMQTLRRVMEEPPTPPRLLYDFVDPDLETICLKCMEKEPERRYGSAESLAEELERWLRGEPIQARPSSAVTRLQKWISRRPAVAGLALFSALAVMALIVGQTVMSVRLKRANSEVRATNRRLSDSLYELRWRQADEAANAEDHSEAIAHFSQFLRENPEDPTAAARLLSLLSSLNFPVPVRPPIKQLATALDFSRAGDRLVTDTAEGAIRVWDVQTGALQVELKQPGFGVLCRFAGATESRLLITTTESAVRLWDLKTHQTIAQYQLPLNGWDVPPGMSLTRDLSRFAVLVKTNAVAVFDADTGTQVGPPLLTVEPVEWYALSSDGQRIAAATRTEARVCSVETGKPLFTPLRLAGPPLCLDFSDDSRWLLCGAKNSVRIVNSDTGRQERELALDACADLFLRQMDGLITFAADTARPPRLFDFCASEPANAAPDSPLFGARRQPAVALALLSAAGPKGRWPGQTRMNDPVTGRPLFEPFVHQGPIGLARFSPDGRRVATASQDQTVRIWSMQMAKPEPLTLRLGQNVWEAQWSRDGRQVLCVAGNGEAAELALWDPRTGALLKPPRQLDGPTFLARWAPDGTRLVTAGNSGGRLWDAHTLEPVSPPLSGTVDCAFSPRGEVLATAMNLPYVQLWNAKTGKELSPPLNLSDVPIRLGFSSDGTQLAVACMDGSIYVWSVPEGKVVLGPLHHAGLCWIAAFSPDGRSLVSASSDRTVRLWDAASGRALQAPLQHESAVLWAEFSPNGQFIATSTESGMGRVWDASTGQLCGEIMRHPGKVWLVKWSPDSHFLATICTDGYARVWDSRTGHLVAEPFRHGAEVRRAEFSPDGRRLLTASFDGTARIWDLSVLRAPVPVPDWLPEFAESLAGIRMDAQDTPEAVSGDSFQRVKERLAHASEPGEFYHRWAQWMLEGRLQRPVQPFQP